MRLYGSGDVILCLGRFCCVPLLSALVGYRVSFLPALASPRFRLARQSLPFSLVRWLSGKRVVFGRGGRPNGKVQLLVVSDSRFVAVENFFHATD